MKCCILIGSAVTSVEPYNTCVSSERSSFERMSSTSAHRCETCGKSFSLKASFKRHREQTKCSLQLQRPAYACEVCKKTFLRKDALKRHSELRICLRRSDESAIYTCELCKKTFDRKSGLKRHNKRPCLHSPKKSEVYTCDHCQKTLASKSSIERHINDKVCKRTIGSTFIREKPPTDFQLPSGVEIKATAFNRYVLSISVIFLG